MIKPVQFIPLTKEKVTDESLVSYQHLYGVGMEVTLSLIHI